MKIREIIWLDAVEEKIFWKHNVQPYEVEELLMNYPHVRFMEKGYRPDEDLYAAFGHSNAGRYLVVYFIRKQHNDILIVTTRNMTKKEKRKYGRKRK